MKNTIRRFAEWLYKLTFEVGENHFDTFGSYPEDDAFAAAKLDSRAASPAVRTRGEQELAALTEDPVAYTRARTSNPAVLALMDEVERGRARREQRS
jgi:hypothetical protein